MESIDIAHAVGSGFFEVGREKRVGFVLGVLVDPFLLPGTQVHRVLDVGGSG